MSNIVSPQIEIHYISELKKVFVGRNNQPIYQLFKVDSEINDYYYFQIVSKNNQIVSLHNRKFEIYGSYIDARQKQHILFHNSSYGIEDNTLIFEINTYTDKYLEYVTVQKEINITIVETTNPITQVVLRDKALAYPRPYIDGKTIQQIVEYETLTGINVPLIGGFGAGVDLSFVPDVQGFLFGEGLIQTNLNQFVVGQYNMPDAEQTFIVGNGTDLLNRSNLFTISYDGTAYLSGNRILTNLDRVNVSELNNDIGYITLAEVPVYEAGTGLMKQNNTFSLTAAIPSAVSQLTNDTGFITVDALTDYALKSQIPTNNNQLTNGAGYITGYNAGSGISIVNGTINCTVEGGGGGATYTAGEGIGIDSNNVISLTATIPTAVSQLSDAGNYATTAWVEGKNYLTAVPDTYALKTDVPSAVSQLTNDSGFITIAALSDYATTGQLSAVSAAIPTSTSQLTNDSDFITSSALTGISVDNQQKMLTDNTVYTSAFVLGYDKDYDIFTNTIQINNGVLNINPVSGFEDIAVGKTATFEQWIKPNGALTGITIGDGLQLVGELPSSFTNNYTQVFTRRIINNGSYNLQQISYAYEFDNNDPALKQPFSLQAINGGGSVRLVPDSNPGPIVLDYKVNDGAWSSYTIGDTINLNENDIVAFSGANVNFSDGFGDYKGRYIFNLGGNIKAAGNIQSLVNFSDTCTDYCFNGLFGDQPLVDASELLLPATNLGMWAYTSMFSWTSLTAAPSILPATSISGDCYSNMFGYCMSLTNAPQIMATSPNSSCGGMFMGCSSLTSITVHFTDWGINGNQNWVQSVAANGTFIKPASLSETYGDYYIPSGWTVENI